MRNDSASTHDAFVLAVCQICEIEHQYFNGIVCSDCPDAAGSVAVALSLLATVLLVACAVHFLHGQRATKYEFVAVPLRQWVHRVKEISRTIGLIPKAKVALTFTQVIAAFDSTYAVSLPESWFQWCSSRNRPPDRWVAHPSMAPSLEVLLR